MTEKKMVKKEKASIAEPKEKKAAKWQMKNLLMFLPNMLMLCGRLLTDKRVPAAEKALFAGAILYAIMPLDFIPDVFPFIGQVDDVYLIALTLMRLVVRTDETIVREHWSGGGDIIALADSAAKLAPLLMPKRVSRILSSKVDLAPTAKNLLDAGKNKQALIVEIPQPEETPIEIKR